MNWKGFGSKWSWHNFKVLFHHSPGWTEENDENYSQDSRSPCRDLSSGPFEYEAGVLTTLPRRSVNALLPS
jgi:hypothetical protein